MITGELVLPETIVGMIEASTTRRPRDAVDPQLRIDDGQRVAAHLAGADRMEDRRGDVAGTAYQVLVALKFRARQHFLRPVLRDRLRLHQAPGMADGLGRRPSGRPRVER